MATTQLEWADCMNEVAAYLGAGYESSPSVPTTWNAETTRGITRSVASGYNKLLYPPDYVWSWMRSVGRIQTVSGQAAYLMPEDYGGLKTQMTYDSSTGWVPVTQKPMSQILRLRQSSSSGGYPTHVAFVTQKLDGVAAQREVAEFWPPPNGAWTLSFVYDIRPTPFDSDHPVPLGGPEVSEALKQLCIAAAELDLEDIPEGPHWKDAQRCLAEAIRRDKQVAGPKILGKLTGSSAITEAQAVDRFTEATSWTVTVET